MKNNTINNDEQTVLGDGFASAVINNNSHVKRRKKSNFRQVEDINYLSIQCPSCGGMIGLDALVVAQHSDINFRYACPYCHHEGALETED